MPNPLPDLNLSLGQVLWSLNHGREPDKLLKDQVRYLRLLGIPKKVEQGARGSGNRIRYDFFDLVEMGLALEALNRRFTPKSISAVLNNDRERMTKVIEAAWLEIPEAELGQTWVKSRGSLPPGIIDDLYLRLHERRHEKWGKLDFLGPDAPGAKAFPLGPIERFEDGTTAELVPIKRSMVPWVVWAWEAPEVRTGPR